MYAQPMMDGVIVFTPQGGGIVRAHKLEKDTLLYYVQLPLHIAKQEVWLPADEVHSVDAERGLRAKMAHIAVMREVYAINEAKDLGVFPDMSQVAMPNDPAGYEQLGRGLRKFFALPVYKPADLGSEFSAWLSVNRDNVRIRLAWGPQFHEAMFIKADEVGAPLPKDARPLYIGARGGKGIERAPKGYVWFPSPPDLKIIREEFNPKVTDSCKPGEVEIANVRLALGLVAMGYVLTDYTKTKQVTMEQTPPLFTT